MYVNCLVASMWCFVECLLPVECVNGCVKSRNCLNVAENSLFNTTILTPVVERDARIPGVFSLVSSSIKA